VLLVISAVLLFTGSVAGLLLPFETAGKVLDDAGDDDSTLPQEKSQVPVTDTEVERAGLLGQQK
jgi:hypothetical protein